MSSARWWLFCLGLRAVNMIFISLFLYLSLSLSIYIYIYIYVCVCVCFQTKAPMIYKSCLLIGMPRYEPIYGLASVTFQLLDHEWVEWLICALLWWTYRNSDTRDIPVYERIFVQTYKYTDAWRSLNMTYRYRFVSDIYSSQGICNLSIFIRMWSMAYCIHRDV